MNRAKLQRTLLWAGLSLLILLAAMLSTVGALVYSERGSFWLLTRAAAAAPGELKIQDVSGSLAQGLRVARLNYSQAALEIRVDALALRIDWAQLSSGTLRVATFKARSIHYRDLSAATPPQPLTLPDYSPLPLTVALGNAEIEDLTVLSNGRSTKLRNLQLRSARLTGNRLRLDRGQLQIGEYTVQIERVAARLNAALALRTDLAWRSASHDLSGVGSLTGNLHELEFEQRIEGRYPAKIIGTATLLGRIEPQLTLRLSWPKWQIQKQQLGPGELHLDGTPSAYQISGNAQWQSDANPLPVLNLQLNGVGNLQQLEDFRLDFQQAALRGSVRGHLHWQSGLAATGTVVLDSMDASLLDPRLNGRIQGQAQLHSSDAARLSISDAALQGTINGAQLQASAALSIDAATFDCRRCELRLGDNRLTLNGRYAAMDSALDIDIDAPRLDQVWPQLSGKLQGQARLLGRRAAPTFEAALRGAALRWQSWSLATLALNGGGQPGTGDRAPNLQLDLDLDGFTYQDRALGSVQWRVSGTDRKLRLHSQWQLQAEAGSAPAHAELLAQLRRDDGNWEGQVEMAQLSVSDTHLDLRSGIDFYWRNGVFSAAPHHWKLGSGTLELDALHYSDGEARAGARLDALPLQLATPWLPGGLALRGEASAELDLALRGDVWRGTLEWRQADTTVLIPSRDGAPTELLISAITVHTALGDDGLNARAEAVVEPGIRFAVDAHLAGLDTSADIDAQLQVNADNWQWLPALVPELDGVNGRLRGDLRVTGTLKHPHFQGRAEFDDGSLAIPALNIQLQHITLHAEGRDQHLELRGKARAGNGHVGLSGYVSDLFSPVPALELDIDGDDAAIMDWPEYRLWTSPQLHLSGGAGGWRLDGELLLPRALIAPAELPKDSVTPSADVHIRGGPQRDEATPAPYRTEIRLRLGDNVRVRTQGLDTRIEGQLLLRKRPEGATRAEGQLHLRNGSFSMLGQSLRIDSGTLTFTGPLDKPLIDVRAQREVHNLDGSVLVGIHARGREGDIETAVFSEPPMSEADILAYLTTGRPLSQLNEGETRHLSDVAIALGARQSAHLTAALAQRVGLDELNMSGAGDQTALVAGKALGPRLYARYAYGVFNQIGTLFVGYRLSQHLRVEAGSGEQQTIELLYGIDKP